MKRIGKGSFSSVYRQSKNKVLIISTDPAKECMSLGWFPDSRLFPKVIRLSINDDGTQTYTMKYYDRITAPKKQLNERSFKLYQALRRVFADFYTPENIDDLYSEWIDAFRELPNEFKTARNALIEAVEAMTNYGPDICFEISPRNIAATKAGNLVLLDCFFIQSKLPGNQCLT